MRWGVYTSIGFQQVRKFLHVAPAREKRIVSVFPVTEDGDSAIELDCDSGTSRGISKGTVCSNTEYSLETLAQDPARG